MIPIKIKTKSVPGTAVKSSFWWHEAIGVWEVSPRAGFIGWLGRQLKIYRWGWVERNVSNDVTYKITPAEINRYIKEDFSELWTAGDYNDTNEGKIKKTIHEEKDGKLIADQDIRAGDVVYLKP